MWQITPLFFCLFDWTIFHVLHAIIIIRARPEYAKASYGCRGTWQITFFSRAVQSLHVNILRSILHYGLVDTIAHDQTQRKSIHSWRFFVWARSGRSAYSPKIRAFGIRFHDFPVCFSKNDAYAVQNHCNYYVFLLWPVRAHALMQQILAYSDQN